MTQWIDCDTRFSGRDTPARLDLLFTSDNEAVKEIRYESPLGKSDHVLMEISLGEELVIINEEYKMEMYRYNKTNFKAVVLKLSDIVTPDSAEVEDNYP